MGFFFVFDWKMGCDVWWCGLLFEYWLEEVVFVVDDVVCFFCVVECGLVGWIVF